jgi:hypothetical protein
MSRLFSGIGALVVAAAAILTFFGPVTHVESQRADAIDWPRYQDMAVDLMQQYLRIDTSNPPGNEIQTANFFKRYFS